MNGSHSMRNLPANENRRVVRSCNGPIGTAWGFPYLAKKRFFAAGEEFTILSFNPISIRKSRVFWEFTITVFEPLSALNPSRAVVPITPPARSRFSTTVTLNPDFFSSIAAHKPLMPAPITIAFFSIVYIKIFALAFCKDLKPKRWPWRPLLPYRFSIPALQATLIRKISLSIAACPNLRIRVRSRMPVCNAGVLRPPLENRHNLKLLRKGPEPPAASPPGIFLRRAL